MIPAMQRGDPQWSELRAVGVGWWIRNINTLRKMVEKVSIQIMKNRIFTTFHQRWCSLSRVTYCIINNIYL